ncbi:uncharacterized protein UDID_19089 [Ustilago sp. UG-2017a]|nr:uncharacterized protein UDID_19089 [Ustilago sp. UG-2017a]
MVPEPGLVAHLIVTLFLARVSSTMEDIIRKTPWVNGEMRESVLLTAISERGTNSQSRMCILAHQYFTDRQMGWSVTSKRGKLESPRPNKLNSSLRTRWTNRWFSNAGRSVNQRH